MLAERIGKIGFSPTLAVSDLAGRMRAEGIDVLDFSAGQPDFPTPDSVKDAGKQAIDDNQTRYTATAGLVELRHAIAEHVHRELDVSYEPNQIVVSPGAKASLYFAFMTLLDPGDEVIVPTPYWTSYPEQIRLAGGEPTFVECGPDQEFKLTPEQLAEAITPRSKVLLLNYPSNPTGACYDQAELAALAEVCARHDLWIVADEIYAKLVYDDRRFASLVQCGDEVRKRTLLIDGMSKTYSMTGWRIGYAVGPKEVISGMAKLQSHSTSNATSIAQWASIRALQMTSSDLAPRIREFQQRRDVVVDALRALPGVSCLRPGGAFYVFPNFAEWFRSQDKVRSGQELAKHLLEESRVAVVPGEAFGAPEHIRISYAISLDRVREGVQRIAAAMGAG